METPRLVVIEGPEKGRIVPLREGTIVIGRSKGDVILQDPRISRSHVALHVDENTGRVTFTDLKSLNGVQHNGDNKDSGDLKDGDQLQLGNTVFDCQTGGQEESSTEPAINLKKAVPSEDPKRSEDTHVSSLDVLMDLKPEPTAFGEPVFEVEPASKRASLVHKFKNLPKRTKIYSGAAVLLLLVAMFLPGSKSKSGGGDAEREFASIRKLESEGKLTEAAARAEKIKTDAPTNPEVHRILGDLYSKQKYWEQSIEAYRRAFDLDSKQIELLPKLARLQLLVGNTQAAQSVNAEIDHFLAKGPHTKDFFVSVADLYLEFPKLEPRPEKMVIIGQAIQNRFAPDSPSGFKLEALGHIEQGQPEEAIKVLDKAKEQFPQEESIYPYLVLGKVRLKDFTGANTLIDQWIGLFPQSLQPLVLMGQLKYQVKEYDESLKYLQKAVQLGGSQPKDPNFPKALFLLGELYYQQNQVVEAENALRQSCEMGLSDGCEHILIKGGQSGDGRTPQSLKK